MVQRYDLRSKPDLNDSSYASLPGMVLGEFVPHNMTPLKSNLAPGRNIPGCHPNRWMYEFTHNDFTTCDIFQRAQQADLDVPFPWQHEHKLVVNGNQSFSTSSTRVLSSICLDCHFHFVFKISWDEAHSSEICNHTKAQWPLLDSHFPWHHLVWVGSDPNLNLERDSSKYYPLMARENFTCSAPPCTFALVLEVSRPRMQSWWINLLTDSDAILQRLQAARERYPEKYEQASDRWAQSAAISLNTYLKNELEPSGGGRRIQKQNKRFAVVFGPPCFRIFRELEFEETFGDDSDIDDGAFIPRTPSPPGGPNGTTEMGTYRGYLEDVRAEVQCLIHKAGQAGEPPTFFAPALHEALGCQEIPKVGANVLVNLDRYKLLGVLPDQDKKIVVNAYKRQWDLLPNKRRELIEALMGVANDANDELLSDYAMTQSSVFESQLEQKTTHYQDGLVPEALVFLGLQPPNNYSADTLIKAFRQKIAKEPAQAEAARNMLLLIAQESTDETYQAVLIMESDQKMSLATSKVVLGLENATGFGPDSLEAARSKIQSADNIEEKKTYLAAMDAIAEHTHSLDLKREIAELRERNGIEGSDRSLLTGNHKGPVNYELPVGLENIGNTCYLNSLLQYLFTVKPVREIVLNYEDYKLDLGDETITQRLLGGNKMQMDRGEAVVAQAFAQELSQLFHNLQTSDKIATRPSQRLANAVLLSTHTLLNDHKTASELATASEPPPLPTRPSPAPPSQDVDDVDMINNNVNSVPDPVETASTVSSRTLVDQGDANSDRSNEKVETLAENQTAATAIESFRSDVSMGEEETQKGLSQEGARTTPTKEYETTRQNIDVNMTDLEEPETVDQKVLTALEHQKRSSGTDQQDVEEVMGSIINRLQAAIRPSSVDQSTGIQLEKIMETFFVTTINYTKKFDQQTWQQEVSFDRSITAFPAPEGTCSLYDALGRNFDQQIIEEGRLSRYTAIKTLPPVLHVLIQRSQSMGSKNGNPVDIPETLYLDRYMDAPHDSEVFQNRVKNWIIANRISDLKAQKAKIGADGVSATFLENYEDPRTQEPVESAEGAVLVSAMEENWDFDGPVEDDFLLINSSSKDAAAAPELPAKPEGIEATETVIRNLMENELRHREETLEQHFASLRNVAYRLHAVICHRGHLMSGHYWVWIHDFEKNVWHKYNDSNVEVNKNTEEVLKTLSTSGEPYFLCYVRDEDKDEYVDVPRRHVPGPQPVEESATVQARDVDGDVAVSTVEVAPPLTAHEDSPPPCTDPNMG